MTTKNFNVDAQFAARLNRAFGLKPKSYKSELRDEMRDMLDEMRGILKQELESEINGIVKQATSELLGNGTLGQAFGEGIEQALSQVVAGKKVNTRSVANSVAKSFTPYVDDLFRKSSSQAADEISSLVNLSQRNL